MTGMTVRLEIFTSGSRVNASLIFHNSDKTPAFLEKSKIFYDGSIENNLFQIMSGDRKVPYVGIMAKRAEPGPDDFLKLDASQEFKITIDLAKAYDFFPGRHTYRAYYSALHSYPDNKDFWPLRSNEVTFTFSK